MVAISRVSAYAHLSEEDLEALGRELDGVRSEIEDALGASDAAYIRRTILLQRTLDVAARIVINRSRSKVGWLVGTIALATAKSIENMEIAHNVGHGQWDWMNDPEIHSSTWEWDMAGLSSQWRYSHNYTHHVFSNILGMDDDIGFGVLRVTRDQDVEARLSAVSRCETSCWQPVSNGVSRCTACTPARTGHPRTPGRSAAEQGAGRARLPGRWQRTT